MSITIPVIVTGDDVLLPTTLKIDNATFNINIAATVSAKVVSSNHQTVYSAIATQSSSTPGADWANSLVIISLPSEITSAINFYGDCELEIQVDDNGKTTWFAQIEVEKGNIP